MENKVINNNTRRIKNRDIVCYLSVPNKNDWKNIKIIEKPFHERHYKKCYYVPSKERKQLEKIKNDISTLFKKHKYPTSINKDENKFYRIIVTYASDIKTMYIKESKNLEEHEKQMQNYSTNCFKYKVNAEIILKKIADILGIQIPKQKD